MTNPSVGHGIQTTKKRKHEIFVLNEKAATPEEHQSAVSEKEETKHERQGRANHADPEPKHAKPSTTEPEHQLQINNDDHEDLGVVNFWEDGIVDLPDMGQISEACSVSSPQFATESLLQHSQHETSTLTDTANTTNANSPPANSTEHLTNSIQPTRRNHS